MSCVAVSPVEAIDQRRRQIGRRGLRVGEFRAAQGAAIAHRHLEGGEHVHEAHRLRIGHVGVPGLPGIRRADQFPVHLHVGQDRHLGHAGLVVRNALDDLDIAEADREPPQFGGLQRLAGKAQHAMLAERAQHGAEVLARQVLAQIGTAHRGAEYLAARFDGQHAGLPRRPAGYARRAARWDKIAPADFPVIATRPLRPWKCHDHGRACPWDKPGHDGARDAIR